MYVLVQKQASAWKSMGPMLLVIFSGRTASFLRRGWRKGSLERCLTPHVRTGSYQWGSS